MSTNQYDIFFSRSLAFISALLLLFFVQSDGLLAQTDENQPELLPIENSAVREEVQRYFGYEELLYRYLTLPYDLSQNVNQKGRHVDFGFGLFAIMPLLLLVLVYKRKRIFYTLSVLLILYLSLCFRYSHIVTSSRIAASYDSPTWEQLSNGVDADLDQSLLFPVYKTGILLSAPIRAILDTVTGARDHITYPILCLLLFLLLWGVARSKSMSQKIRHVILIFLMFSFLWYLISGGILWYGFLMIPLGYVITIYALRRPTDYLPKELNKGFNYFSILVLTIWLISGFVFRVSNIDTLETESKYMGRSIVDLSLFYYSSGEVGKEDAINLSAANVHTGMLTINKDNRKIYQVGTHLIFDIKNNHLRVFEDNTLATFSNLVKQYPSQRTFIGALKKWGFGYILIDLNTPSLDKTPEKSLVKKYQFLLSAVKDNPLIRLVATDRKAEVTINGEVKEIYAVFGDRNKYPVWGSYAIYEIL